MDDFKAPSTVPQDILLIQDLIGNLETPKKELSITQPVASTVEQENDNIASSDSEVADEDEVEAELIQMKEDTDREGLSTEIPSSSDSESDSSSSDGEDAKNAVVDDTVDDEDEPGLVAASGTYFRTKNEVAETDITIPEIDTVGDEEFLEKVGEIMSVLTDLVIVRGSPSENLNRGSERALDSDTLLVFSDRKVLGYTYETFGPTSQPLYQVRFNKSYPLDPSVVTISREVFHVPARSNFVFLNQIRASKGSDASNVNDEEPAEHELDFSDDEAETAHKRSLKKRRSDSRAPSVASSRHSTPGPSQLCDQDLDDDDRIYPQVSYAHHAPDDFDFENGPSRPIPLPYDDPYSDVYVNPIIEPVEQMQKRESQGGSHRDEGRRHESMNGRGRGRGRGGRGRERNRYGRGPYEKQERFQSHPNAPNFSSSHVFSEGTANTSYSTQQHDTGHSWGGYPIPPQQGQLFNFGTENSNQGFIQPHINPRFAAAFGMGFGATQSRPHISAPGSVPHNPPAAFFPWQNTWPRDDEMHPPT